MFGDGLDGVGRVGGVCGGGHSWVCILDEGEFVYRVSPESTR